MLDYDLLVRCRLMLQKESNELLTLARQPLSSQEAWEGRAKMSAVRSARLATCAEACEQAEHALFNVLSKHAHMLDDGDAEKALRMHVQAGEIT